MRYIMVMAAVILAGAAQAAPADCLKITNDLNRLACYDKETGRTPSATTFPQTAGQWGVRKETSKLTDQPTVVMSVDSDEIVNCGCNRWDKIALVLRCMENKTVFDATGSYSNYECCRPFL